MNITLVLVVGARRIFSRGGQIRGLGTKVSQWGLRVGAPLGVWGWSLQKLGQVVKIMH